MPTKFEWEHLYLLIALQVNLFTILNVIIIYVLIYNLQVGKTSLEYYDFIYWSYHFEKSLNHYNS